jgi:glutathione S-transferase
MILYGFPGSPNTWKVRALADHIGADVEFRLVDLPRREQRSAEFLAINPTGRTPALVDGDFKLWESNAIMNYITDRTGSDLFPANARTRADITRWQSWQLQHWAKACEPMLAERVVKALFGLGPPDQEILARAGDAFETEGGMLDRHLATRRFLVEDRLTVADFSVASYLFHAERAGMPLAALPNVSRWFGAVSALPAWHRTAPTL